MLFEVNRRGRPHFWLSRLRAAFFSSRRLKADGSPRKDFYDRALKSLLGDEVAEILLILLPGSEFVGEQNIAIDRTTIKADLVYNVQYRGNPHVLN